MAEFGLNQYTSSEFRHIILDYMTAKIGSDLRQLLRTDFRIGPLREFALELEGGFRAVDAALLVAHRTLVGELAALTSESLAESVSEGGRKQRENHRLVDALANSSSLRAVDVYGFSYPLLDRLPETTKRYAFGLEFGSDAHVGQVIYGMWRTTEFGSGGGELVGPISGGRDALAAVGWRRLPKGVRPKKITINKGIDPYEYVEGGVTRFDNAGFLGGQGLNVYVSAFRDSGAAIVADTFFPDAGGTVSFASEGLGGAG